MEGEYKQPEPSDKKPLEVDVGETPEATLTGYDESSQNLVPFFKAAGEPGEEFLKKLAEQVCSDSEDAWDSCEDWRERTAENNRIITGHLKKKNVPYEGCANAHMPIALERLLRLTSNVFVEIFQERDTVFGVKPTGPDDYELAELLTIHGNWQIQNEQTDFLPQQHRGIWNFFAAGSVFAHSSRDTVKGRNRHDILSCDEIFLPYVWTTVERDMSDVPYKGRLIRKYRHELEALRDHEDEAQRWSNVDEILSKGPPAWDSTKFETKARDEGAKGEGIVAPERNKKAPYVFFEYHGWAKLPASNQLRPICAIVDTQTKAFAKLYVRDEEDWRDRARYDLQIQEMEQYAADMQVYQQAQQQEQQLRAILADPMTPPDEAAELQAALDAEPLQPPMPPAWMEGGKTAPDPVKRVPIEQFSHGVCVENPFGALGLSFGSVLCDLNRLSNEAYNRFYDAAALGNVWSIITPGDMDFANGGSQIPIGPGKQIKVKGFTGEQLRNSIVELKPAPANAQLLEIVRISEEAADSSIAAPSVLSGEPGKSGETFRGLATRVERATRQLSAAGLKYLDFLTNILKNNARLNAYYMPDEEVIQVLDHMDLPEFLMRNQPPKAVREMREIRVGRAMYQRNYDVTFTADVRFASQAQRIAEADELVAMTQIPAMAGNYAFAYHAIVKALQARRQHDLIPTLGPPPPVPEVPMGTPPPGMMPGMPPGPEAGGPPGAMPPPEQPPGIQGPKPEVQA